MQRFIPPIAAIAAIILSLKVMALFVPCSHYGDNGGWATHEGPYPTRPLAYRVLVPTMADTLYAVMPEGVREAARNQFIALRESRLGQRVIATSESYYRPDEWGQRIFVHGACKFYNFEHQEAKKKLIDDRHILYTGLVMVIAFGWLLAFLAMLYALAKQLFGSPAHGLAAPVIALLILPYFVSQYAYTYDFAELFFVCAGLYLLLKERLATYLICFALATLNKESSVYMIAFFAVWFYGRLPWRQYVEWLLWQALIFAGIKMALYIYFMEVPGQMIGHFFEQNWFLLMHMNTHQLLIIIGVVAAILYGWRSKPLFLCYALILLPINIIAYMVASFPGEYRSFYGSLPVVILMITHTLVKCTRLDRITSKEY